MSYNVDGSTITLTRGDTFIKDFPLYVDGKRYELCPCDEVRFAAKLDYDDPEPAIFKKLDGYTLTLNPEDTKGLEFGTYKYDVQITLGSGRVITYMRGKLKLDKEVH